MQQLIHGDCLEVMKSLEDASINLTVTVPPNDNLRTFDDGLIGKETVWKSVLQELYRVTKQGGAVVWVINNATIKGNETGLGFKQALLVRECGFKLHDIMIWNKGIFSTAETLTPSYTPMFEYIFVLSKGNLQTFNPIKDRPAEMNRNINYPAPCLVALVSDFIKSLSNENDLVLDPFMGSGDTAIACLNTNRNSICIEKDETYYKLGAERVAKHELSLTQVKETV